MTFDLSTYSETDDRLLHTLQSLLAIVPLELHAALTAASDLVCTALRADKVDVFLYDPQTDSLVALGTSTTPLGRKQHALGLNRLPCVNGGPVTRVFETKTPYQTGHAELDPSQPRGMVDQEHGLGIRSQLDVPLQVGGETRGVLAVASAEEELFTERDLLFLQAVAGWIGLVVERSELAEARESHAFTRGKQQAASEVGLLTPRQREVAICIAEGLTNEEIAERLVITIGTAANHLEAILRRLDLKNRTQIATWAVQHGLYQLGAENLNGQV
jgi:two-component system OmpR family sensor kinase